MAESKTHKKNEDPKLTGAPIIVAAPEPSAEPTREEIAVRAYDFWVERGSSHGSHEEDWYRAEEQLRSEPPATKAAGA